MLYTTIALFALAALLGMYLISFVLQGKETPKSVAFTHGGFAAAALLLLIYYTVKEAGPVESVILFVIAALGGFVMIARDLSGKSIPKWLAVIHGLVAVTGFVFLLVHAFAM